MTLSWGDIAPRNPDAQPAPALRDLPGRLAALALAIARRPDLWRPIVRHEPELRWHCRLADLGDVEVWLLAWTFEQEVELHHHGGSSGAFAVAEGELCEDFTELGDPRPLRSALCPAGVARAFGPSRIHHVTNRSSAPATSIHVYSPPLSAVHFYEKVPGSAPESFRTERIVAGDAASAAQEEALS